MTPDDPRHGTTRGYAAGCHDDCCKAAMRAYRQGERHLASVGATRAVPAIGAQRRIRALMRIGWTSTDIAQAAGWSHRNYVLRIINGQKGKETRYLEQSTADAISAVYDRLWKRLPQMTPCRARTRTMATRRGYPGALAWDDDEIDDPTARPRGLGCDLAAGFDESRVLARIAGDRTVKTRGPENVEVVRRMLAAGWTQNGIRRHTGLKVERYMTQATLGRAA